MGFVLPKANFKRLAVGLVATTSVLVPISTSASAVGVAAATSSQGVPTVSNVSPSGGSPHGGTLVTISGTNLSGATAVRFGSYPASSFSQVNSNSLNAVSPNILPPDAGTNGETVDITVTTPAGTSQTSSNDQFTFAPACGLIVYTIQSVSPTSGPYSGGTNVTITGCYVGTQLNYSDIYFGNSQARPSPLMIPVTANTLLLSTPPGTGTVPISVHLNGNTTPTNFNFTYTGSAPIVTSVSPNSGSPYGGTSVTITGTGFTGTSAVSFGTHPAESFSVVSDTQISAVSPGIVPPDVGTNGQTVDITVTTVAGTSPISPSDQFSFGSACGFIVYSVQSVSPTSGPSSGGTLVLLSGCDLGMHLSASDLYFGSSQALAPKNPPPTSVNTLAVASPPGTGTVPISIALNGGTPQPTSFNFTYTGSAPTVTSVSPNSGSLKGGNIVAIRGTGFKGTTSVQFGSNQTPFFSVVDDTLLYVIVPPSTEGPIAVTVTNAYGTSSAVNSVSDRYTYLPPGIPAVTSMSPNSGPASGGTVVKITGTDLENTISVQFGASTTPFFYIASPTLLYVFSIPGQSGQTVPVMVNAKNGSSVETAATEFTYK